MNKYKIIIFNLLGLSCIFGAIFLEIYIFSNILLYKRITLIEPVPYILIPEFAMSIFSILYFQQLFRMKLRELDKLKEEK